MRWGPEWRRQRLALLVLAGSVLLALGAAALVQAIIQRNAQLRFENAVQATEDAMRGRLERHEALLQGAAGLFAAVGEEALTRAQFHAYADRLSPQRRYPGAQGFGYSRRLPASEREAVEARARAEGLTGFRIWPEGPRAEYHTILFLEPLDERNRAALGFDMYSEPVRREAMARAWATGEPALSGKMTLKQEISSDTQAGFQIYVPLYEGGAIPDTEAERLSRLAGFVYAPFRAGDFFADFFGSQRQPRTAFQVFDGEQEVEAALLYDSRTAGISHPDVPEWVSSRRLTLGGRTWTVRFTSLPSIESSATAVSVSWVLGIGLGVSLLLFLLMRELGHRREEESRSEARLRAMADSIPQLAWIAEPDGAIHWFNRRWYEYTGTTPEEMELEEGWGARKVQHPDELERVERRYRAAMASGEPWEDTFPLRRGDGEFRAHLARALPLRDEGGRIVHWIGTNTDVEEARRANAAVMESEARFRNMADHAPVMLWVSDASGTCTYLNRRWYEFTGQTEAEALGFGWLQAVHPEDRELAERTFREANARGAPFRFEFRLRRGDGEYRWVLDGASPRLGGGGEFLGYIGSVTEIHERRQMEDALRERADLERQLIGIVSHDLKNPLAAISMSTQIALRREGLDERTLRTLQRIHASVQRAIGLIQDLLDFTQARLGGGIPITPGKVALERVVEAVVQEAQLVYPERTLEVRAQPVEGEWDGSRLGQALSNLVGNALKYSPPGTPVTVEVEADGPWAQVSIHNLGPAIPEEVHARLFQPFHRQSGSADKAGRSVGLGLFIVHELIRAHGGQIEVRSAQQEGTRFTVRLPRTPPAR